MFRRRKAAEGENFALLTVLTVVLTASAKFAYPAISGDPVVSEYGLPQIREKAEGKVFSSQWLLT